jgi:hypothetical protein
LGRRPMPNGAEIARCTSKEVHKVAPGPLQPRPTHTPSRRCAPCGLRRVLPFVLWRAAALDAASSGAAAASLLSQLETASFCRRSASPSPLRGHACSLNAPAHKEPVSGLCQVRCLHMLILAAITSASQGEKSSRGVFCHSQPTQL